MASPGATQASSGTPTRAERWGAARNVGAWFGRLVVVGLMGQVLYFFVSSESWLLASGGGRSFIMIYAVLVTLAFMGTNAPSLTAGGLAISAHWARHLALGLLIGLASAALYLAIAVLTGSIIFSDAPVGELVGDLFVGAAGGPLVALVIAMIIPGWLFGELRRGWPLLFTVAVSSLLGAAMITLISPDLILEDGAWARLPTLILALALLSALRHRTGDLILTSALISGWLIILRSARKANLLSPPDDAGALAMIFAPNGDHLAAPALWVVLAVAIFLALAWPMPKGDRQTLDFEPVFKRLQIFSHLGILAPLDVWLGVFNDAKWKVDPLYLARFVGALISSTLSLIITLPERLLAPLLLAKRPIAPPIFILGVHRSGTTHLQNLLALDPRFATARTRHVLNPFGFLVTGWLMAPLLWAVLPLKRPQDSVKFGLFSPNEEEYALANMCRLSPDWSVRMPRRRARYDRYLYPEGFTEKERATWTAHYRVFLAKLTLFGRRRPLLKNPFNTGRAGMLAGAFCGAQFVHIHRDPFHVYRSYLHLARSAHPLFQLHEDPDESTLGERFCDTYKKVEERYYADAESLLGDGMTCDVRFEDLEADPIAEIRRIYRALKLDLTPEFERKLERYVEKNRSYKKNVYRDDMPDAERRMVEQRLGEVGNGTDSLGA